MKKSNAQAERPSNRVSLPRASRPLTEVFEQNAQADLVPLRDHSAIFLFLFRLQAQAHSNRVGQPRASSPPPPFLFL